MRAREPEILAVATERTDRSRMKVNFPVERHYFSSSNFQAGLKNIRTEFGSYHIYDAERSICDILHLGGKNGNSKLVVEMLDTEKIKKSQYERILKYAKMLNVKNSFYAGIFQALSLQKKVSDNDNLLVAGYKKMWLFYLRGFC